MAGQSQPKSTRGEKRSLVESLVADLRAEILDGKIPVGGKLPSEAALTAQHAVSRTVVREAVAALRSEGLVEPRQGSGVYVTGTRRAFPLPFENLASEKLSSLVEMMEFRIAVEAESAALAAARRSPAQDARIAETLDALDRAAEEGQATGALDLEFHLAVAQATNNPRFVDFLTALGKNAIPRSRVAEQSDADVTQAYYDELNVSTAGSCRQYPQETPPPPARPCISTWKTACAVTGLHDN